MGASRSLLPETPSSSTPPGSAGSHIHVGASPHPPARGAAAGSAAPKPRCLARRAARPRRTALARSVGTAGGRRARMPFPSQPAGGWRVLPRSGRPLGTGGRPKTDRQGRLRGWGASRSAQWDLGRPQSLLSTGASSRDLPWTATARTEMTRATGWRGRVMGERAGQSLGRCPAHPATWARPGHRPHPLPALLGGWADPGELASPGTLCQPLGGGRCSWEQCRLGSGPG